MGQHKNLFLSLVLTLGGLFACSHTPTGPVRGPNGTLTVGEQVATCEVKLTSSGAPIDFSISEMDRLAEFRKVLNEVTKLSGGHPDFQSLKSNSRLTSQTKARTIIREVLNPDSELSREVASQIVNLGGLTSAALWDFYFRSYDKAVAYADGYLKLFMMADSILPKTGKMGVYGTGTGNDSATLVALAPGRYPVAVDKSPYGISVAKEKLHRLTQTDSSNELSRFDARVFDITKEKFPAQSLDFAFTNNVLYSLPNKLEFLKNVYDSLKPGAIYILNDPADVIKQNKEKLRNFMELVGLAALDNQAPITEYEFAMVAGINAQVLMKAVFMTPEALITLVKEAGFEVHGRYTGYYGSSTFLVLQKPN